MPENTWPELVDAVEANGGVYRTTMENLRLLEGAQRVGDTVIDAIEERFKELGFMHLPPKLPMRAGEPVLVLRRGKPFTELITVVREGLGDSAIVSIEEPARMFNELAAKRSKRREVLEAHANRVIGEMQAMLRDLQEG